MPWRAILSAGLITTVGAIPVFLLSAQSVDVRRDLGFDEVGFGVVVSTFFASAAVVALTAGRVVDRLGRRVTLLVGGVVVAVGGFGTAGLAHGLPMLLAFAVLLGVGNAACQLSSNLMLSRGIPPGHRGLGFGVKQSAVPFAIMLGGLSVPTVGAWLGWRASFWALGAAGVLVLLAALRPAPDGGRRATGEGVDRSPYLAVVVAGLAITLASAAANSLGAFLASWAFEVGLSVGQAGVLMAVGSASSIVVRVWLGHRADLRHGRNLPVVALDMAVGSLAVLTLAWAVPWSLWVAGILAFAVGWSWPGLMLFAVARLGRDTPAFASGIVQAGAFAGGAAGPALFGLIVGGVGYQLAWQVAAGALLVAAALVLVSRGLFVRDLRGRPPREPFGYGGGRAEPRHTTPGAQVNNE